MKKLILFSLVLFALLWSSELFGQSPIVTNYPKNYFASPLDIPLVLAGNFGELRPGHFHTGLDFTTHGKEGLNVRAAADGYVSRIKIGPWGYGHVIYVTHPNGYVTVYGHLSAFDDAIAAYTKGKQYAAESFEIELFPKEGELPVKKGEVIAFSGNTGSSGGPHLHFEIRDAKTEDAINPLLFGFPVKDDVAPVPVSLLVCPASASDVVNAQNDVKRIPLKLVGGKYVLANPADSLAIYGTVGFAIEAYDKESNPDGNNGVYSIQLLREKKLIYAHHFERLAFDKSRFINSFIDYKQHELHNHFYMRSFLLPNNQLGIYDSVQADGYCKFTSDSLVNFSYVLTDAFGNKSTVEFRVRSLKKQPKFRDVASVIYPFKQVLLWDTTNVFEESAYRFETPSGAFYQNEIFGATLLSTYNGIPTVQLGYPWIPIQKECVLTLHATIPAALQPKAVLVTVSSKGNVSEAGGEWKNNGVTATIKEFGTYSIRIDTVPPKIATLNFDLKGQQQTNLSALSSIKFTIGDALSGIKTYRGTIDGKWVLMEYEPKKKMLWYTFDEHCGKGQHQFVLEVADEKGNVSTYSKTFSR